MAQFDADIKLKVAVENLEKSVRKVENAFKKVQDYRVKVKIDGQSELKSLGNSFKRLGQIVKTSGIVTAVAAITGSLQSLNNLPIIGGGLNTSALGEVVSKLGAFSNAAADAAASAPGLAAGIAASTAALIAFGPQIARAAKDTLRLGRVAAEAAVPIKTLGEYLGSQSAQGLLGAFGDLPEAERLVKAYRDRLYEVNETVGELSRRQRQLKTALDGFNSGGATAEKIATKLVDVNRRLNDELREQADLLRRASGVNVTELEASKGRKSAETSRRAESFRSNQTRENAAVQASLERLEEAERAVNNARLDQRAEQVAIQNEKKLRAENNESIKALERRAQLEERIANQRSARIAKQNNERAAFLRGNPNQYGEGAVGPQSGRFAAGQAATKQAQQRFAIQSNITKSLAGQTLQYRVQLALLQQAAKIGAQITASTREQEKIQRRLNRQLRVRKGREAQSRRKEAITNATIGGAFPLLFGQGLGASIGGGVGGGLGGLLGGQAGFAGSLVGTAVGQSFDNLIGSAITLGKALNPLATDLKAITSALGIAGTNTEKYINALESAGQGTEAAAFAIRKLEELIGSEGVSAFEQFGRESQALTNSVQKLFTQMQAGLADVINSLGILRSAAEGIDRAVDINSARAARGRNPELDKALDALDKEQSTSAYGLSRMGIGGLIPDEATEAEKKVLEEYNKLLIESGEIIDANAIKARQKALELESELMIAEQRVILERGNNDILNASVEAALRAIAAEETRLALIEAQGDARKIELALLNAAAKKLEIDNAVANARARAGRRGGGVAAKSKELSLQQSLVKEEIKRANIALKYTQITQGEEAALRLANQYISERLEKEIQIIELQRQAALESNKVAGDVALINQLYDSRLQTVSEQLGLERVQNTERLKAIQLERELLSLSLERENAAISRGISREIENAQARLANPFGGEALQQLQLQLEQTRRYNDAIRSVSDSLQDVNRKLQDRPYDENLQKQREALERRLSIYKELLPVLDQIEQKELRQQQIIEKYSFVVDGLASGLSDAITALVTGTETVEEAFSRMFANIGKAFIDMATKMLAQQLMLTVLQAFTGGVGVGKGIGGIKGLADGGYVTGPTPALVGEGGEPEYVIPASKMGNAMNRWNAGYRGESIIDGAAAGESGGGGVAVAEAPMSVTINGGVMQMNNEEYIRRDQVPSIIDQASKAGERKALRRLQMSPTTRRKLGM